MSGRIDHAEEAFSRAAVLAYEKFSLHADELLDPRKWLIRLTYNVCMDLHRELRRERDKSVPDSEIVDAAPPDRTADSADPERLFLIGELESHVHNSVLALPRRLREVMILLLFEDCSYPEISEWLRISLPAVRKRVQQARSILKTDIESYLEGSRGAPEPRLSLVSDSPRSGEAPIRGGTLETPCAAAVVQIEREDGVLRDITLLLRHPPSRGRERALESLEKYVRKHPKGWKKRLSLARLLTQLGRFGEASRHYREVLQRQPQELEPRLELAAALDAIEGSEAAGAACRQGLNDVQGRAFRAHLEGWAHLYERDWNRALRSFAEAVRLRPNDASHWIALSQCESSMGRFDQARESLDSALKAEPNNALSLTLSHDALIRTGRPRRAREQLERAFELDDCNALTLIRAIDVRTRARLVQGPESQKTRRFLRRLKRLAGECADTHFAVARYRLARGEWKRAERVMRDYADSHASNPRGWLRLSQVLSMIGKTRLAREASTRAHDIDPHDREIRLAKWSADAADLSADEAWSRVRDEGQDPAVAAAAARAFAARDPEAAVEFARHSCDLEPESRAGVILLGELLRKNGRCVEAIPLLESCWAGMPSHDSDLQASTTAHHIGECWRLAGNPKLSRIWNRTALERAERLLAEAPAEGQAIRALALEALDRPSEALEACRAALQSWIEFPQRAQVEAGFWRLSSLIRRTAASSRLTLSPCGGRQQKRCG